MKLIAIFAFAFLPVLPTMFPTWGQSGTSDEKAIRQLIASLPPESGWRQMLKHGARGDGVHHPWMDNMHREGVKLARFIIEFDWANKGRKLSNWRVVSEEFFGDYDQQVLISQPDKVTLIQTTGLQKELENVALSQAKLGNWFEYPHRRKGVGYKETLLADNEWLPVSLNHLYGQYEPGTTPLMHAAMLGDSEWVRRLLEQGVNPNAVSPDGDTALTWAAATGTPAVIQALLHAGAKVNMNPNSTGNALIAAVANNRRENVEVLLKASANPTSRNSEGRSALSIAVSRHYDDIAELLKQAGARQ